MCAVILVVVVLPFVPVIAMIGILPALPLGKSISITGSATLRARPFQVQDAFENQAQHLLPVWLRRFQKPAFEDQ